jgi:hypothetical protein
MRIFRVLLTDNEKTENKAKLPLLLTPLTYVHVGKTDEKAEFTIRPFSHFPVLHGIRTSIFK